MAFLTPSMVRRVTVPRFDLGPVLSLPLKAINDNNVTAVKLAAKIERALKDYGVFEIENHGLNKDIILPMYENNIAFFDKDLEYKNKYKQNGMSYAGYVGSGTEQTGEDYDAAEVFTVCKEYDIHSAHVLNRIPCHGPTNWPKLSNNNDGFERYNKLFLAEIKNIGLVLCKLLAILLSVESDYFDKYVTDCWSHARVLHFPANDRNDIGIHTHTDYGFLVIASQDEIGGLYIRPPIPHEYRPDNLYDINTSAVDYPDDKWIYVSPSKIEDCVLSVFPGDFMQYVSCQEFKATPHKVMTSTKDRYAMATFFDPNFDSYHYPVYGIYNKDMIEPIHYGTHFTKMFMRCYPDSMTTQYINDNNLLPRAKYSNYM